MFQIEHHWPECQIFTPKLDRELRLRFFVSNAPLLFR